MLLFSTWLLVLLSNFLLTFLLQAVTAIRNMARQHREFQSRLDDAKKLRLYAQSSVSKHQTLDASLAKVESKSKHRKREAKASAEKIERVEKERDEANQEAKVARLTAVAAGEAKARAKDGLTRARDALVATEEDMRRLEAEVSRLAVERTSLLLELEASKDEVSSLHSQAGKDKESIEEDYQKAQEKIFAYGYRCCVFKHSICGDRPGILDGMPDSTDPLPLEFFFNLGCPPAPTVVEAKAVEVHLGKAAKDPMEGIVTKE